MIKPVFITGNQNKADHISRLLGIPLEHQKLNLVEIQSADPLEVIEAKARAAFEIVKRPVLVDDVSMGFDELGGLPGPFVKYFLSIDDGLEKLCRIADILPSRRATARAHFAVFDGEKLTVFSGVIHGDIAEHAKGEAGYGWDFIFCPDGYNGLSRAELAPNDYDDVYQTIRPFGKLREFLTSLE